jgi:hypothetical protein
MTISRILFIADASGEALTSIVGALGVIKKDPLSVRVIFLSFLSVLSQKNFAPLGPNTLFLLTQEEREILESLKTHFRRTNIRYSFDFVTMPAWQVIFDEMGNGDQDLIILQGQFLKVWRENAHADRSPKCPVVGIHHLYELRA